MRSVLLLELLIRKPYDPKNYKHDLYREILELKYGKKILRQSLVSDFSF